ncbi:MAG: efflux RND transporter periplasmic adaptor subunit [Spirochaetales bacterium]|nr:efflux RND transporter periplasmic adaptor subunit [Spirochaetales bacterium]
MNKEKLNLAIITFLILFLLLGCKQTGPSAKKSSDKEEEQVTVFAVSTTLAVQGEIKDYLQLNGDIAARTTVDTFADTAGKLKSLYVKVGDTVRKDQIIAEIDPSRPGMTFASSPVKASISGTVTQVPVQIGSTVAPNLPIAKISKMDELEVILYVAERFISKMKVGLPAVIKTEAFPGELFTGSIRELSPVVDQSSRTMEIKLHLDDKTSRLKAGMFAEVKVITEEKKEIVKIPAEAMINRFGEYYVFVVEEDTELSAKWIVEKRTVVPGLRIDNQLEITSGLSGGDVVVIRGQTLLEDGLSVKVVSTVEPLEITDEVK